EHLAEERRVDRAVASQQLVAVSHGAPASETDDMRAPTRCTRAPIIVRASAALRVARELGDGGVGSLPRVTRSVDDVPRLLRTKADSTTIDSTPPPVNVAKPPDAAANHPRPK